MDFYAWIFGIESFEFETLYQTDFDGILVLWYTNIMGCLLQRYNYLKGPK